MVASTDLKARLFDLFAEVMEGVREGNRNGEEVADILQAIKDGKKFRRASGVVVPAMSASDGPNIALVLNILGDRKVLTADQAAKAWNQPVPQNVPIRYSEATLRECAEQNRSAGTDWRLVRVFGFSLREQREKRGIDSNHQPCFYNNDWWLKKQEDDWATPKPEPGYYLIDFNGRWGETSWNDQETEIRKLGSDYERTHEAVVSESILSIYQTTQERLLENWYHWGRNLGSYGGRVRVGGFDHGGLSVRVYHPDWDDGDWVRVCVSRKFPAVGGQA